MTERLPALRVPPSETGTLDPRAPFGADIRAVRLEIGFGGGEHLAAQAAAHPDTGFIGCEPFENGVASLLAQIDESGLGNVRIFDDDARLLLPGLAPASLERVDVLFPDPWPKTRHHRRRLINTDNLVVLAGLLEDDGVLRFASDHMGYVRWTLDAASRVDALEWTARRPSDWRLPPRDAVETRYEAKATQGGARCVYLEFRRRPRP